MKVQIESQPWSLYWAVSAPPSHCLCAQGSHSQERGLDTHPQGDRLEEQSHQDYTQLGRGEQFSKTQSGTFPEEEGRDAGQAESTEVHYINERKTRL